MAPDGPTDEREAASTPGASPVAPTATAAIAFYSDPRCPWARVAVHRLLTAADRHGVATVLFIDHRWFPLGDEAIPTGADALDAELGPIGSLEPTVDWHRWAGSETAFPGSSRLAAAWVQAAKRVSPDASVGLDRALRDALFADGRDISDEAVLVDVASGVTEVGRSVDLIRSEVASGRLDDELEHHAELARSELVPASPTIVLTDGSTWTNPGIEFHLQDGVPVVDADDPSAYDEIIESFLTLRHYD